MKVIAIAVDPLGRVLHWRRYMVNKYVYYTWS